MDPSLSLFERYRAMFSLRNLNSDDAAMALVNGLQDGSALFRHEIAYVLGQMQRPMTATALIAVLERKDEIEWFGTKLLRYSVLKRIIVISTVVVAVIVLVWWWLLREH